MTALQQNGSSAWLIPNNDGGRLANMGFPLARRKSDAAISAATAASARARLVVVEGEAVAKLLCSTSFSTSWLDAASLEAADDLALGDGGPHDDGGGVRTVGSDSGGGVSLAGELSCAGESG